MVRDLISLRNFYPDYSAKKPFPVQSGNVIKQWSRLQQQFWADDEPRLSKIIKLAEEIEEVSQDRNVLVHYFWPYGGPKNSDKLKLSSIKPKKGDNSVLEFRSVEISVTELNDMNERLVRIYHSVMVESMNLIMRVNRLKGPPIVGKDSE